MIVRVGATQAALLIRGRRTVAHTVKSFNRDERRSCHRLAARGLLKPAAGYPELWHLTEVGLKSWLVIKK